MTQDGADVAQPPSAVSARPASSTYRRNLPHIQRSGNTLSVTFTTWRRWVLPEEVRSDVLRHCLHDHGVKLAMHAAVVLPDHVHMLFTPMRDDAGSYFGLAEIMNGVKGASAHTVNRRLNRKGHVWQDESFDHVLRSDEDQWVTAEYICANPIRASLVAAEDASKWLWREWVEGCAGP